VLDLKPWLAKFSYSIGLDVLSMKPVLKMQPHVTSCVLAQTLNPKPSLPALFCNATVLDLKPWLAKFSYSIGLDVLCLKPVPKESKRIQNK
jgi:hypothetical protein